MANYHRSFFFEKMPKKFMKKGLILLFVLLFSVSFVFAASGWGDINAGNDSGDDVVNDSAEDVVAPVVPVVSNVGTSSGVDGEYTWDFYIALGVAVVGILIAALFVYLFLRRPKNKWKKKPV